MRYRRAFLAGLLGLLFLTSQFAGPISSAPSAQTPSSASRLVDDVIGTTEKELTGIATEMPADKYEFAPTQGSFRGVRNFARQIKHAAAVQHLVAATILGERITADMSEERGPDAVTTKAEVLDYLKSSFASLKKAAATIDEKNAFAPIKSGSPETRMGLMLLALTHSNNHYGQVVEYLRMNGHTPPQ
jgi:uncharacterized damage-inducible protein DinB